MSCSPSSACRARRKRSRSRSPTISATLSCMACCISSASTMKRRPRPSAWRRSRPQCSPASACPIPMPSAPSRGRGRMADSFPPGRPPGSGSDGPFHGLRNWLRQLRRPRNGETSLRESLEELIEEHQEEEPIDPHERTLLTNILKLHELSAADIMVPRVDIIAIAVDTPFAEAVKQMVEQGHSRVPLFRETLDDVIGIIHIKDLLPYAADGRTVPLGKIARKVLFAAPSMPVLDLLLQMRLSRVHM